MRTVAKFQFNTFKDRDEDLGRIKEVIEKWQERKFVQDDKGNTIIKANRTPALLDRTQTKLEYAELVNFSTLEQIDGGQLQTQTKLLKNSEGIKFQCNILVASDGVLLPRADIRSPKFVREIVDLNFDWQLGGHGERIFSKCFDVDADDIPTLEQLLTAPQRRLPVIVVSELQGETIAGNLHEHISADTCGLAHTCRLSNEAAWALTEKLGKEWSCYNGAVRLFWPFRVNRDNFRNHPLWTYDSIMRKAESEVAARDRFRRELTQRILEASTFVADDQAFYLFESEKVHQVSEASKSTASESGDYKALADLYASENDTLRGLIQAQSQNIETLQQNVEALTIALRSNAVATEEETHLEDAPPETVSDALVIAKSKLQGRLLIADRTDEDISSLNPTAGPPDKILRYLETLARLADALSTGIALGRSIPIWLRENGVECSGDSETVRGSKEARRKRTFAIAGEEIYCEYHAKPSDGVSPDLCARIYFTCVNKKPFVRVGYIGRHFD